MKDLKKEIKYLDGLSDCCGARVFLRTKSKYKLCEKCGVHCRITLSQPEKKEEVTEQFTLEQYLKKEKLKILQKYLKIVREEKKDWSFEDYDQYPTARLLESIELELADDIKNTTSHKK